MPPRRPRPRPPPTPSLTSARDDANAYDAWVSCVLRFVPGMPEALAGLGAVCTAARAAVVRCVGVMCHACVRERAWTTRAPQNLGRATHSDFPTPTHIKSIKHTAPSNATSPSGSPPYTRPCPATSPPPPNPPPPTHHPHTSPLPSSGPTNSSFPPASPTARWSTRGATARRAGAAVAPLGLPLARRPCPAPASPAPSQQKKEQKRQQRRSKGVEEGRRQWLVLVVLSGGKGRWCGRSSAPAPGAAARPRAAGCGRRRYVQVLVL